MISNNVNIRDLVIRTIAFKFKAYVRYLDEEAIKHSLQIDETLLELKF